jgi:hypothetical protein
MKNVTNDWLDLKVPINDLDITFSDWNVMYVSTADSKLRKYDLRCKS